MQRQRRTCFRRRAPPAADVTPGLCSQYLRRKFIQRLLKTGLQQPASLRAGTVEGYEHRHRFIVQLSVRARDIHDRRPFAQQFLRRNEQVALADGVQTDVLVRRLVALEIPVFAIAPEEETLESFYLNLMHDSRAEGKKLKGES